MLEKYRPAEWMESTEYNMVFDDGRCNGYCFPCDENGNVQFASDDALHNYNWCMEHPEKFERWHEIVVTTRRWQEPASGICGCGERIVLVPQYMGACDCPRCGRWYNLFGQELLPPREWEEDDEEYAEDW